MILRLTLWSFLVHDSFVSIATNGGSSRPVAQLAAAAAGILLVFGFWTPVGGVLVALLEIWIAVSWPGGAWASVLAAAVALSLAFLGPGAWSIDARTFGRKRISISGPE